MTINGSFQIAGFDFSIQNAGLDYTSTANQYLIFGTFTLSDVFSASVQLGTGSTNPGITITNGVFQLDNFAFSLDNVAMGAFTLNYVTITYVSSTSTWTGAGQATFPTGWSISASLEFVDGNLNDISLATARGDIKRDRDPRYRHVRHRDLGLSSKPHRAREHHRLREASRPFSANRSRSESPARSSRQQVHSRLTRNS